MLEHWMKPLSNEITEIISLLNDSQFGRKIEIYKDQFPNLQNKSAVILGLDEAADEVRKQLYNMLWVFPHISVADAGNVANSSPEFFRSILDELHKSDIIPIVIGGNKNHVNQQVSSLGDCLDNFHPLFIDEKIRYGKVLQRSYLNHIVESPFDNLTSITVLAYQRHLSEPSQFMKNTDINLNALRLGQIHQNRTIMEPYIRDCDSIAFSINSLKKAEAPAKTSNNPSGLISEHACQICRYAGINERMRSFIITDIAENNIGEQTASLISQMIWYFTDGIANRLREFPVRPEHLIEYMVNASTMDNPLRFFKSRVSGRWWMENPTDPTNFNKLIPCTYEEYIAASNDEIPNRILRMIA